MSLAQILFKNIDNTIHLFINKIASKHNLDENELLKLWNTKNVEPVVVQSTSIASEKSAQLLKLDKKELVELCKTKKLKIGGTKKDIVDRILKYDEDSNTTSKNEPEKKKIKAAGTPVIKKLVEKIPPIHIHKNEWNNFEHSETSLVFNNKTQKIYGRQNKDGTVSKLTKNDIDLCNKYKFAYTIPDNLDKKEDISDIKIKDLDDEEEEIEVEEENLKDDDDEEEFELEEELDEEEFDEEEEYYEEE